MKILFVDDDYEIAITVRALRNRYPDNEISLSNSIKKTIELLASQKYDKIVLDIMFPGGDDLVPGSEKSGGLFTGIRLEEMIRNNLFPHNSDSDVYFLTALDSGNHKEILEIQNKMSDKLIFKPVHTTELASIIGII